MLRNKKTIFVLCLLLFFLILPRIAVYPASGVGLVTGDAEQRYFPQAERLSESFTDFFTMAGPLYSAFLMFFGKINNDMITGSVCMQHILGIVTALLVFFYFRRVSLSLALIVTTLVYSSILAIYLEHTILREALASFFLVLWVLLLSLAARDTKYLKFIFGFFTALTGIMLVLIRIEFIVLFILMPLILFIAKKRNHPDFKFRDKMLLKWIGGYTCLLLVFCAVYIVVPGHLQIAQSYGRFFNIAWHALTPDVFYYENSRYPELLERYQTVLESDDGYLLIDGDHFTVYKMLPFEDTTKEYLSEHPEIKFSLDQMMDRMYIEMMTRNTSAYLKSFTINLQNHLLGRGETITFTSVFDNIFYNKITEVPTVNSIFKGCAIGMDWLYGVLYSFIFFGLFLSSLVFLFIKWRTLPTEVIIAFFVSVIHIFVLAFLSNASHRFRYPIDPFIYFVQIYLILILLKTVLSKPIRFILTYLPPKNRSSFNAGLRIEEGRRE